MLTKSEYSTSTSSLSTVFSGSLANLHSKLSQSCLTGDAQLARPQPSSFRNRLRERINKNKTRIAHLKKVIEVTKNDVLTINDMRKMLYHDEVLPLATFVDRIKNTTDHALLSMQRELAKKESHFEFVVSEQKFANEESAYLAICSKQKRLFKQNFFDKENRKYDREVKHCDRLLKEGEELMKTCKHNIDLKDQKLRKLESVIDSKEQTLADKMDEINRLQTLLSKDADNANSSMKSYILEAKLKNTKSEIKRLRNEKMELQSTEFEFKRELDGLKAKLSELKSRNNKETGEVRKLERKVGDITSKISDEKERQSMVSTNQEKLQKFLDKEIQQKANLLKQVTMKKRLVDTTKLRNFIDTKTMRPTDWNQIDDGASLVSDKSLDINQKPVNKTRTTFQRSKTNKLALINSNEEEESKEDILIDNVYETKQSDLSLISFEADCESTQSETRLPIPSSHADRSSYSTQRQPNLKLSVCKQIASPSTKVNCNDPPKISDEVYLNCTKILEENDEDSVNNLTPRLKEDLEREVTLKEEEENRMYNNRDGKGKIDRTLYASKTTLETEETSISKFDDDLESVNLEKKEHERPLCLSIISSGGVSNEDSKFISPKANTNFASVPALNMNKLRRAIAINTSELNTTNYSSSGSKSGVKVPTSLEHSMTISSTKKTKFFTSSQKGHMKKMSQEKPCVYKKYPKTSQKPAKRLENSPQKPRKSSKEECEKSWKDLKSKNSKNAFKGNHWDFSKKASPSTQT